MLDSICKERNYSHDKYEKGILICIFTSLLRVLLKIEQNSYHITEKNTENWKNHSIDDTWNYSKYKKASSIVNITE